MRKHAVLYYYYYYYYLDNSYQIYIYIYLDKNTWSYFMQYIHRYSQKSREKSIYIDWACYSSSHKTSSLILYIYHIHF